jgi:hypothetical protein
MDMRNEIIADSVTRRFFIGGSDARIIMGDDEAAVVRLWREKRGEAEPEDLSGNLIVQLGLVTEPLNRHWYERNSGQTIECVQHRLRHPVLRWMGATVDGIVAGSGTVFEAKFMLPWSFSEEAAAEKHMAQVQHNMWVTNARGAVLSIITVLSKILRALVDPNVAPVRALPREERELMIAANNGHVLAFDNLSSLPGWLSDALCRIASGGSFALRQLYTDTDEVLFQAARPTILNGIEDIITRQDLADRAIFLTMGSVSDEQRRPEAELWHEFELARPRILGVLLDAVAHGLRMREHIQFVRLPRMADFAKWATACETALWSRGTFLMAYDANRSRAVEDVVDADPVAACVRRIMAKQTRWVGTASDLLDATAVGGHHLARRLADWPKNPRALAGRLRRSQAFLRTLGIEIAFKREGREGNRIIRMTSRVDFSPSAPSASSATAEPILSEAP